MVYLYLVSLVACFGAARAGSSAISAACSGRTPEACMVDALGFDDEVSQTYSSATALYSSDKVASSGWFSLDVHTTVPNNTAAAASVDRADALLNAAFSAGVAEGALTCTEIAQFAHNVLVTDFGLNYADSGPNDELLEFISANDAWVQSNVAEHAATDEYWLAVGQVTAQMDGILAGLNNFSACSAAPGYHAMSRLDLLLVNLDGDLFDLQTAYPDTRAGAGAGAQPLRRHRRRGDLGSAVESPDDTSVATDRVLRCSALIKATSGGEDVWFGHDTWDTYATAAPRIFKTVSLPVLQASGALASHQDSFSSSPGFVASVDDYYVLAGTSRLTVIETSNNVYNTSVYNQYLTPESNMCWVRTMVANMLASDGASWGDLFGKYHSGTYNNQWLLLDANQFASTAPPTANSSSLKFNAGLLWIVEEAPGLMHAEDMTSTLEANGYWASYNVAFFDDIRARLGEPSSFDDCPRANLFREMQGNVTDAASMQWVMGWNNYENNVFSEGNPDNAIMARGDLLGWAGGGIDSKCSSLRVARSTEGPDPLTTFARAGPTHDELPAFCWTDLGPVEAAATPHEGHPICFNYSWSTFSPEPDF